MSEYPFCSQIFNENLDQFLILAQFESTLLSNTTPKAGLLMA